jgi:predicted MFS family arabinose efflux permease
VLTFLGLAGPVLALIRQPVVGWSSPEVWGPGVGGIVLLGLFLVHERRTPEPMLPLGLFKRRNFAVGNIQTFVMYAGLGVTFFFLVLVLQEVCGYSALQAGLALMPATLVMFALSKRVGRLADRIGPRLFMGLGPLTAAAGLALMLRLDADLDYFTDLLPALLLFSIGLSGTVAPLTATVLSDADESNAGIASGVNNAIARIAGLLAVSFVGIFVASRLVGDSFAKNNQSVSAFHELVMMCAGLIAAGGIVGAIGITNPTRDVSAERCSGGQLVATPEPAVTKT